MQFRHGYKREKYNNTGALSTALLCLIMDAVGPIDTVPAFDGKGASSCEVEVNQFRLVARLRVDPTNVRCNGSFTVGFGVPCLPGLQMRIFIFWTLPVHCNHKQNTKGRLQYVI